MNDAVYFRWMADRVSGHFPRALAFYGRLLSALDARAFTHTLAMDQNRAADGVELRYRFARENDCDIPRREGCSVLEMMVALAIRCEEHIMADPFRGDRTGQWFWNMLVCMGLSRMDDERFDERAVNAIVTKFLRREYEPNGRGGIAIVNRPGCDLRRVDIWYQMMWYLASYDGERL